MILGSFRRRRSGSSADSVEWHKMLKVESMELFLTEHGEERDQVLYTESRWQLDLVCDGSREDTW